MMSFVNENFNAKKVVLGSTTMLNGLIAGGLCFVSGVDVPCMRKLKTDPSTLIVFANVWWPCGRDYMQKMIPLTTCLNIAAWYMTKDKLYLGSGLLIAGVGLFTATVMKRSIESINGKDLVPSMVDEFCSLHHFRAIFALTATVLVVCRNFRDSE